MVGAKRFYKSVHIYNCMSEDKKKGVTKTIIDGFVNFFKEYAMNLGDMVQEDLMEPDVTISAINAIPSIMTQEDEINDILKKNPGVSRKQASIDVAFMNGLIGRRSYNLLMDQLKDSGEFVDY